MLFAFLTEQVLHNLVQQEDPVFHCRPEIRLECTQLRLHRTSNIIQRDALGNSGGGWGYDVSFRQRVFRLVLD